MTPIPPLVDPNLAWRTRSWCRRTSVRPPDDMEKSVAHRLHCAIPVSFHFGADHYDACQYGDSTMAQVQLGASRYGAFQYGAGPVWHCFGMALFSIRYPNGFIIYGRLAKFGRPKLGRLVRSSVFCGNVHNTRSPNTPVQLTRHMRR